MSKDKLDVISADQHEAVARIKTFHQNALRSQRSANVYRFLCGVELNRQKDALPHGEFGHWCETNLPFLSKGTSDRYRQLADVIKTKFPTVGIMGDSLTHRMSLVGDGQLLPEKETKQINEALFDALDGKTITQFMRDEGIIRPPKDPNATERKTQKLTEEEKVAAQHEAAEALVDQTIESIMTCLGTGEDEGLTLSRVKLAKRKEFLAALVRASKLTRKFCKSRRSEAQADKGKGAKK